jgi:hypothetical protein
MVVSVIVGLSMPKGSVGKFPPLGEKFPFQSGGNCENARKAQNNQPTPRGTPVALKGANHYFSEA